MAFSDWNRNMELWYERLLTDLEEVIVRAIERTQKKKEK